MSCCSSPGLNSHCFHKRLLSCSMLKLLGQTLSTVKSRMESGSTRTLTRSSSISTSNLPMAVSCMMAFLISGSASSCKNARLMIHWLLTAGAPTSMISAPATLSMLTQVLEVWPLNVMPQPLTNNFLSDLDIFDIEMIYYCGLCL